MRVAVIVPAAGSGRRFGGKVPKQFLIWKGRPLLVHTLLKLEKSYLFEARIVAVAPKEIKRTKKILSKNGLSSWQVVAGGSTRAESVWNGLRAAGPGSEWVLVHDAARPMVSSALVRKVISAARKTGAALAAVPAFATVKKVDPHTHEVLRTENRDTIFLAQTPQIAKRKFLEARYRSLGKKAFLLTDEAAFFDGTPIKVRVVTGEAHNIKITTPEDLALFRSSKC